MRESPSPQKCTTSSSSTAATSVHEGGLGTSSDTVAAMAFCPAAAASVKSRVIGGVPALGHPEPARQRRAQHVEHRVRRVHRPDVGVHGVGHAVADDQDDARPVDRPSPSRPRCGGAGSPGRRPRPPRARAAPRSGRAGPAPWCRTGCSSRRRRPHRRTGGTAAREPAAASGAAVPGRAVTALIGLTSSRGLGSPARARAPRQAPRPTALPHASQNLASVSRRAPQCGHVWAGAAGVSVT